MKNPSPKRTPKSFTKGLRRLVSRWDKKEEEPRTQQLQKKAFAKSIFVPDDVNWQEPEQFDGTPSTIPIPIAKIIEDDPIHTFEYPKELDKKPSFRLGFPTLKTKRPPESNNNGHTTPKEVTIHLDALLSDQKQEKPSMLKCPSRVFCEKRASIVSDITIPEFSGRSANAPYADGDSASSLDFPREDQPRKRSASLTNIDNLRQVMEFFPMVQKGHVEELLKRNSIRTALNILAEESNPDDFPIPEVMEPIKTTVSSKEPISELKNPPVQNSEYTLETMVESINNSILPPEKPEIHLNEMSKRSSLSLSRANSYISFSEYEKEHKDLQQAIDIFPDANRGRVNFLLRQHTLSTVMLMLASENTCG